jgi:phosphatidylserine decarboxylase
VDYHRFHFPVAGVPDRPKLIDGSLYSVNPIALRRNIHILSENKRALCRIQAREFGQVLMLEIGATCVGSFEYTFRPGESVAKGALFEPGHIRLDEDLVENSRQHRELYARMGDHLGMKPPNSGDDQKFA